MAHFPIRRNVDAREVSSEITRIAERVHDVDNRVAAAQADLAGTAVLADVIAAHNALLAKLRAAGLMQP